MTEQLVLLLAGFLLTTVLGGLLGTWFQRRTWEHQNERRLHEEELRRAGEICQSVSQLLDKRLYRMLRLFYPLRLAADLESARRQSDSEQIIQDRLRDYDAVLYEWNDRLNLNLAMVGTYFGENARDWLDLEVYEAFQSASKMLEDLYRTVTAEVAASSQLPGLERALSSLNDRVYRLGVFMMTQLREGRVGRSAPRPLPRPESMTVGRTHGVPLAGIPTQADE